MKINNKNSIIFQNQLPQFQFQQQIIKKSNSCEQQFDFDSQQQKNIIEVKKYLKNKEYNPQLSNSLDIIISILQKSIFKRKISEIQFLKTCLEDVDFVHSIKQEIPQDIFLNLFRFLQYEEFTTFTTLFHQGDYGKKFYILLKGSIVLLVKNSIRNQKDFQSEKEKGPQKITNLDLIKSDNPNMCVIAELYQGSSFGEIALITEGSIRMATAICSENCKFAVLTTSAYYQIVKQYHEKILRDQLNFLKNISIFKNWDEEYQYSVLYFMQLKQYQRNDIIIGFETTQIKLYFIKEGEIQLSTLLDTELFPKNKNKNQELNLAILGKEQYFGDHFFYSQNSLPIKAKCLTGAEVYELSQKDFMNIIQKLQKQINIFSQFEKREKWYLALKLKKIDTLNYIQNKDNLKEEKRQIQEPDQNIFAEEDDIQYKPTISHYHSNKNINIQKLFNSSNFHRKGQQLNWKTQYLQDSLSEDKIAIKIIKNQKSDYQMMKIHLIKRKIAETNDIRQRNMQLDLMKQYRKTHKYVEQKDQRRQQLIKRIMDAPDNDDTGKFMNFQNNVPRNFLNKLQSRVVINKKSNEPSIISSEQQMNSNQFQRYKSDSTLIFQTKPKHQKSLSNFSKQYLKGQIVRKIFNESYRKDVLNISQKTEQTIFEPFLNESSKVSHKHILTHK